MKKVLFVATVVKLHIMVFHIPYLEWFKKNGYEVHVCARNDYENKDECKIPFCDKFYDLPFERLPFKKNNIYVLKELKNIIDINRYDIIHCHTPMGGALGRLAAREARNNGTKVIYTAHGFHFYKGAPIINWLVYYPVERWLARYTDVLITINKEDYNRAKKFKNARIEYIPGVGINTDKFENVKTDKEEKRKLLDVRNDEVMILSVGELNKNKNHQVIIKAIAKLNNKKIKYVLCGQGPLKNELIKLSKELKVENQILFLGFRNDVSEIYKVADLFAFPSYREGLSLSLMEAMSSGLPAVCSNIRGNKDLIKDGKGGYLINPDDIEGFREAIKKLVDNDSLRRKMGRYNTTFVERYSIDCIIEKMTDLYTELLSN